MKIYTVKSSTMVIEYEMDDYDAARNNMSDSKAIDLLKRIDRGYIPDYNFTGKEDDFEYYKLHMAIQRGIAAINRKDNWIPVERGLPDNLVNPITRDAYVYPVTVDLGGVTDVRYYSFWKGHWYNQSPHTMDHLVIAWMPRPEPYQPEKK